MGAASVVLLLAIPSMAELQSCDGESCAALDPTGEATVVPLDCFTNEEHFEFCCCSSSANRAPAGEAFGAAVASGQGPPPKDHCVPLHPEHNWEACCAHLALGRCREKVVLTQEQRRLQHQRQSLPACFANKLDFQLCCCATVAQAASKKVQSMRKENCWRSEDETWESCCQAVQFGCDAKFRVIGSTQEYWEHRYTMGGSSSSSIAPGACGASMYSYRTVALRGLLERLKVGGRPVATMLDLGVGDGCQAMMLLEVASGIKDFVGLDLSRTMMAKLTEHFGEQLFGSRRTSIPQIAFFGYDGFSMPEEVSGRTFEVTMSLQVVMHILEEDLFEAYMRLLFNSSKAYVIIHGDNADTAQVNHVRSWRFTDWIEQEAKDWSLSHKMTFESFVPEEVHSRPGDALWVFQRSSRTEED